MAVQAIGTNTFTANPGQTQSVGTGTASARTARTGGAQAGGNSDSTTVVSKTTKVNADGSVTVTITYADGHTKTETTASSQASALYPAQIAGRNTPSAARGNNLDITA